VVGVFADSKYDQETIHLNRNDLLVVIPMESWRASMNMGRVWRKSADSAVRRTGIFLQTRLRAYREAFLSWSFAEERDDDMTLVIAKVLEQRRVAP